MKIRRGITILIAALATATFMGPVVSAETLPPSRSNPQEVIAAAFPDVGGIIANAKTSDDGFSARRDLIALPALRSLTYTMCSNHGVPRSDAGLKYSL